MILAKPDVSACDAAACPTRARSDFALDQPSWVQARPVRRDLSPARPHAVPQPKGHAACQHLRRPERRPRTPSERAPTRIATRASTSRQESPRRRRRSRAYADRLSHRTLRTRPAVDPSVCGQCSRSEASTRVDPGVPGAESSGIRASAKTRAARRAQSAQAANASAGRMLAQARWVGPSPLAASLKKSRRQRSPQATHPWDGSRITSGKRMDRFSSSSIDRIGNNASVSPIPRNVLASRCAASA